MLTYGSAIEIPMFSYSDFTSSSVDSISSAVLLPSLPSSSASDDASPSAVFSSAASALVFSSETTPFKSDVSSPKAVTEFALKELSISSTGITESSFALTTLFSP